MKETANCDVITQAYSFAETFADYNEAVNVSWRHMMHTKCDRCITVASEARLRIKKEDENRRN